MSGFSGGGAGVNRNYLINPSGMINQIGAGSQTDVTYDFDQWLSLTQTAAITASQQTDVENGTPFMMRSLQAQAVAQRFGRIQWLEKPFCRDLRGQPVTLSARVQMSASTTLRYAIIEWTGTADTITKDIVNDWTSAIFTAGNFFTSISTTVVATGSIALTANTLADIAALTGAVSSSMNNLAVFFWTDSTQVQNVTLDIGKVKLEKGASPTAFVADPFSQQLRECKRWWRKSYDYATAPGSAVNLGMGYINIGTATTGSLFSTMTFDVDMMKTPTGTIYDLAGASGKVYKGANGKTGMINVISSKMINAGTTDATSATELAFQYTAAAQL